MGFPGGDTLFALQAAQIARLRVLAAEAAGVPLESVHLPWCVPAAHRQTCCAVMRCVAL